LDSLSLAAETDHDVCIVDSLNCGPQLIRALRRLQFDGPIIVLTRESATEVLDAIHQGAADCLFRDNLSAPGLEQSICGAIDRARSLKTQAQHERCYLGLMENASEIIYTHDLAGYYTSINKAGEQLMGYTAEELRQMNIRQILAPEYLLSAWRAVSRMLANRQRASFEAVVLAKDGRRVHIEGSIHLIYREGTPVGVQGIARETLSLHSVLQPRAERSVNH
jgi:PAS domain S-box-containing protein